MKVRLILGLVVGIALCMSAIENSPSVRRIVAAEADQLRGGQGGGGGVPIGFVFAAICDVLDGCQDDGCGGNFPIENCGNHVNRIANNNWPDEGCISNETYLCVCWLGGNGVCAVQTGTCKKVQVAPGAFVCAVVMMANAANVTSPSICSTQCF